MTVAQDADTGFDLNEPLFRRREVELSRKKEAGQRLHVSAAQKTAGAELHSRVEAKFFLRCSTHSKILTNYFIDSKVGQEFHKNIKRKHLWS